MNTVCNAYKANPNEKTKAKLLAYVAKHPMSVAIATDEQIALWMQAKA